MYNNAKSILTANKDSITWLKGEDVELLKKTKACTIVCLPHIAKIDIPGKTLIAAENPKLTFIELTKDLHVDPPSINIGMYCKIHPSAVLGSEGFGYEQTEIDVRKFPHFGGVVIGNFVDIGAHTCIDRGALEDTVIGDHTKIDNLVHIAHNVKVGERCLIVAQSGIGGSCVIGDGCYIGFGCTIKNGVTIGEKAIVGMGAIVLKDIPPGEVWAGNPAKKLR